MTPPTTSPDRTPPRGGRPRVVIVGRPNVGKSSLFNAMAGQRIAIEDRMAGVTRDRVSFVLGVEDRAIELVDTGGIGTVDAEELRAEVERQIAIALEDADVVLFLVDAKAGVQHADRQIAERLRRIRRPVVLVATKVEGARDQAGVGESHALGFGEPVAVSAKEGLGVRDLVEQLVARFGDAAAETQVPGDVVRLAIVGRVNVGKSTLVNTLVGAERVIVSPRPGTTRDAVDVPFTFAGRRFVAIDTAGMRKPRAITDSVEFYGQARAERAIRRASVALLLVDATREVTRIDRQIAGLITDQSVPALIVVTKWDLAPPTTAPGEYEPYLRQRLPHLAHAPIAFVSALERTNVEGVLRTACSLHDQAGQRVTTADLNALLQRVWDRRRPRPFQGRIGKIYYGTQVGTHPPHLRLSVNDPRLFDDAWRRYLVHALQEALPYPEIPVRIEFVGRGPRQGGA